MKKGLTEIVFILDKSGSMEGLEKDTIGGYNAFLEKQKKLEGEAFVSTVLFSNKNEVIHDRVSIKDVEPLTDEQYSVGGCTALLDAIGGAVHHIGNIHKYARNEDVPEKTIFVITTDGQENSSREYDYRKIKHMIERQQKRFSWEFLFLGANIDAVGEAERLGINEDRAVRYECDGAGTSLNFSVLSKAVGCFRANKSVASDWCEEIEEYRKSKE
ncbi:MAG: VWA domain-containing protein [Treponemataceae bacterium]|nr:VWA domain-containing protein [Treponemataceae bacterium]